MHLVATFPDHEPPPPDRDWMRGAKVCRQEGSDRKLSGNGRRTAEGVSTERR